MTWSHGLGGVRQNKSINLEYEYVNLCIRNDQMNYRHFFHNTIFFMNERVEIIYQVSGLYVPDHKHNTWIKNINVKLDANYNAKYKEMWEDIDVSYTR